MYIQQIDDWQYLFFSIRSLMAGVSVIFVMSVGWKDDLEPNLAFLESLPKLGAPCGRTLLARWLVSLRGCSLSSKCLDTSVPSRHNRC